MKNSLKILYISQYFPPEMGAPSARVHELARRWVQNGAEVCVLTGFPHHPTGKIPPQYRQHIFKRERLDGIKVVRTYVYPTANKGFFKRILSYISFMFSAIFLGSWTVNKPDVVIATSPQFFVAIAGYLISRIKNRPFVFEVRDLWPESIVQLGQLRNPLIIRFLEAIELFLYRRARLIVVVAESSIPILLKKGVPPDKIRIVKNGVDLSLFDPQKNDDGLREQLNLRDKFVSSYIGTMGLSHALDKVLETAGLLREQPDIHFLLIGEGAEKQKLLQLKNDLNLGNVTFLDQIEKQKLPYYYRLADVILVTLRDLPLFRCVIPSKIFEIMAMRRPILISVDGEARDLVVNQAQAGIFVEPENPTAMKEALLRLYREPELRKQLGANGRRFVELHFNRRKLADEYLNILKGVANGRSPRPAD